MSSRDIRGPLIFDNITIVTAAGTITAGNDAVSVVNKTVGAASAYSLPTSPFKGQTVLVKDGKGDAASHNITVTDPASNTIDGASSYVIAENYGAAAFIWNGTQWNVAYDKAVVSGGTSTFNSLTVTGSFTDSFASAVSAAGTTQATATALAADDNNVSTVGASAGVALPAATAGRAVTVMNAGANALKVYPINGGTDQINALGANNPTVLPVGQLAVFGCLVAGTWNTLVLTPRVVNTALATVGAGTITAAGIVGGLTTRGGAQSNTNFADTTDTVANLIAALHGATVGMSWEWTYENTTNGVATITGAASVTVSGIATVPPGTWATYLVTFATATTFTMVGYSSGPNVASLPPARTTSSPTAANTTLVALSDLTIELAAGQKVTGLITLFANDAGAAADGLKCTLDGGTATWTSIEFGFVGTPAGCTIGTGTSTAVGTPLTGTTVATSDSVYLIAFSGVVNAAGTLIPQFAKNSGNTGSATVKLNSSITVNTTSN